MSPTKSKSSVKRAWTLVLCLVAAVIATAADSPPNDAKSSGVPPVKLKRERNWLESVMTLFFPYEQKTDVLLEKDTLYHHVIVQDDEEGRRHMIFGPNLGSQSIGRPDQTYALCSNYMKTSFLTLCAESKLPSKVLIIGLGGGIMPNFLRHYSPKTSIDVVEIDPAIPEIATKYFGFKQDAKTRVFIGDGRVHMNRCSEKYDIIFIDAFHGESIPFQLTTVEFMNEVKRCLKPRGILVANLVNLGNQRFITSELRTIKKVFSNLRVFICEGDTNYVPIATMEGNPLDMKDLTVRAAQLDDAWKLPYFSFGDFLKTQMSGERLGKWLDASDEILTDDFAPIILTRTNTGKPAVPLKPSLK